MIDLLPFGLLGEWLAQATVFLALLLAGLLLYGSLTDRAVFEGRGQVRAQAFGRADLFIAAILGSLFLTLVAADWRRANESSAVEAALPSAQAMVVGILVNSSVLFGVIFGILASLNLRGINWREAFGVRRLGPGAVLGRAILLLLCALPLIQVSLFISQFLLAAGGNDDASSQEIVRFLGESPSGIAKAAVAVSAVFLAPLAEEFIFRGYLYGVLRRYAGVPVGILINAALFAAIHLHAPSFGGLFVLAVCLTLAYEWTGSLLVPMTMHALFNSISIIQLLAG